MATIADNINGMAELVAALKKRHRISEPTIIRLIEINLAYANQQGDTTPFDSDLPLDEPLPFPEIVGPDDIEDEPTPDEIITAATDEQE